MDAFQPALRKRPVAEPAEREVLRQLVPHPHCGGLPAAIVCRTMEQFGFGILSWIKVSLPIGAPVDPTTSCTNSDWGSTSSHSRGTGLWTTLMDPDLEAPISVPASRCLT